MNTSIQKTLTFAATLVLTTSFAIGATPKMPLNKEDPDKKDDFRNPTGCMNTGYAFDLKTIRLESAKKGQAHAMFLFLNKSSQTIFLLQMRSEESSRSMFLNHTIPAKNWGVFATSEQKVKYICTIPKAGTTYGEVVDCKDYLNICEFTHVKFGLNNRGNYWLVNSSSKNQSVREIVHYGIIPMSIPKDPNAVKNAKTAKRKQGSAL